MKSQCERCMSKKLECIPVPTGPCFQCKQAKQGCSLMVHNEDGTPIRSTLSPGEFEEYRLNLFRKQNIKNINNKGRARMRDPPEEKQAMVEDERFPSATLGGSLQELPVNGSPTVDKGASSEPGPSQGSTSCVASELAAAAAATTAAANPASSSQDVERELTAMREEIRQLTKWKAEMQDWVKGFESWVRTVNAHMESKARPKRK